MTLALAAVSSGSKCISLETDTCFFNTTIARVAKIFESIENFEKASCSLEEFGMKHIVRLMYGFNGYVCDDDEMGIREKSRNEITLVETAAEHWEEVDKELHIHQIKSFDFDAPSSFPN